MIERIAVIGQNSELLCSTRAQEIKHIRTVRLEEWSLLDTGPMVGKTCLRSIYILLILIIALGPIDDILDILLYESGGTSADDEEEGSDQGTRPFPLFQANEENNDPENPGPPPSHSIKFDEFLINAEEDELGEEFSVKHLERREEV